MHLGYRVHNVAAAGKTADYWREPHQCRPIPQKSILTASSKKHMVAGSGGSEVCLVTLSGAVTAGPRVLTRIIGNKACRNLKATDEILDFFIKHPKQ